MREQHPPNRFGIAPEVSSWTLGWKGLLLQRFCLESVSLAAQPCPSLLVHVHRKNPIVMEVREGGRYLRQPLAKDDICITPAGTLSAVTIRQPSAVLAMAFNAFGPDTAAQWIDDRVRAKHVEMIPQRGVRDRSLLELSLLLEEEAASGGQNGKIYAEGLSTAFMARLTNVYATHSFSPVQYKGGLIKYALRQVSEYVEANLSRDVSLEQLARIARMSPYHFSRLFRQSTGCSPHQYVINRRMERARELLIGSSRSLADISREVGYESQSHFTAVFRRTIGLTPKVFRAHG